MGAVSLTLEAFNMALGNALKRAIPEWENDILVGQIHTLQETSDTYPDILVVHHSILPVAIEISAGRNDADTDARSRLGMHVTKNGERIQTAIIVEITEQDAATFILHTDHMLRYALYQPGRRFPMDGFVYGTIHDLARLVAAAAITKETIGEIAGMVADSVTVAANMLKSAIGQQDQLKISHALRQRSALSGLRTTIILWLDAYMVQQRLVNSTHNAFLMTNIPDECVSVWNTIQDTNGHAIFKQAIDILDHVRAIAPAEVSDVLKLLMRVVRQIRAARLGPDINIGAELFPRMAEDRKESAAFYTQPATAELLAALTIPYNMTDWSDSGIFKRFRIADMACGTGTLLRFGYKQVKAHHMTTGCATHKGLENLHRDAMEYGLVGTDISPVAAHLTSTGLAINAGRPYDCTNIGWVPVGGENRTGAIEYIVSDIIQDLMTYTTGHSTGWDNESKYGSVPIKDGSIDVILMNPPYSRTRIGQRAFDIAGLSDKERTACQKRWGHLIRNEPCTKTAGMAATFLCVARKKIRPGGRIGFVLPRTAAFVNSWESTRAMIERDFEDITVIAVASGKARGREAFSADTMMEEMLLIATRKRTDNRAQSSIKCVTLHEPVGRLGEATVTARAISATGTGQIMVGTEIGVARRFETHCGQPWSCVGAVYDNVATISNGLASGELLDLKGSRVDTNMTTLEKLFTVGPTHHIIGHIPGSRYPLGAFTIYPIRGDVGSVGEYRSLWSVDSKKQTKMVVLPTRECIIHDRDRAGHMWNSRSVLFYCRKMSWNAQVVAAMTEHAAMGGNMWISLQHADGRVLKAFALWANSIYGMMTYWSRGSRTHPGRSMLDVRAIRKVPCPQLDALDEQVLDVAATDFERLSTQDLLPACKAVDDRTRASIDDAVSAMLGIPDYDTVQLTKLWCAEPSVKGIVH